VRTRVVSPSAWCGRTSSSAMSAVRMRSWADSDVTGLGNEVKYSKYRNGNDRENHVRKIATMNVTQDVVLRRGMIGDLRLFDWLNATPGRPLRPTHGHDCLARRGSSVGLRVRASASASQKVARPCPCGEGAGEVAMEERHLVAEQIDFSSL
jgi:hypothetical protein